MVSGKFQLVDSDEANMDQILAALGASDAIRQMNKTVKPIFEYSKDGEDYVAKASVPAMGKEHVHKFRLNVEQDETTLDGRKVKSTYQLVDKAIVKSEVWNGKTVTYKFKVTGDELVTVSLRLYNLCISTVSYIIDICRSSLWEIWSPRGSTQLVSRGVR